MTAVLEVLRTGPQALVQDLGRPGHAAVGVGRSGAADRAALRLANRLVANPEGAAGLEVLLGGLAIRPQRDVLVAVTGAPAPLRVSGRPVPSCVPLPVPAGSVLELGTPSSGVRSYVAVRGGLDVPPVLGSRSTDVLSALGPPALAPGALLPVGPPPDEQPLVDVAPVAPPAAGTVELRALLGPRDDWFADPAALARARWTVSDRSDRVGIRLDGEPLVRRRSVELPSEGVVPGTLQVPPDGRPVLFLADGPVTGGYPVVAVVLDADLDRAAQLRPGQAVRFRLVT